MMPIPWKILPLIRIVLPTAAGSEPRCPCQKAWLTTATASRSATASSRGPKNRPRSGRSPSIAK